MINVPQSMVQKYVKDFSDSMRGRKFHVHVTIDKPRGYTNQWVASFANHIDALDFAHKVAQDWLQNQLPFEYVAVRSDD